VNQANASTLEPPRIFPSQMILLKVNSKNLRLMMPIKLLTLLAETISTFLLQSKERFGVQVKFSNK
jgi:hypothetical protein